MIGIELDGPKDHDIQSWLMGQVDDYMEAKQKKAVCEIGNRVSALSKKYVIVIL